MMSMDEVQQLREEVKRLKQENQELRERLMAAEATIKQLLELLGQNSHNSNWPSSRTRAAERQKVCGRKRSEKQVDKKAMKGIPWPSIQSRMSLRSIAPANVQTVKRHWPKRLRPVK